MAVGNTFGATALASYGGFWISFAIVFTPGGFDIESALQSADNGSYEMFYNSLGLFLMVCLFSLSTRPTIKTEILQGWFIFTTVLLLCTLRSTVAFFSLFFSLDLAFLLLGIGYLVRTGGEPTASIIKAGGFFALLAAFLAWYNALAGIADSSNSFFIIPVAHFPWSEKGRERRTKAAREVV